MRTSQIDVKMSFCPCRSKNASVRSENKHLLLLEVQWETVTLYFHTAGRFSAEVKPVNISSCWIKRLFVIQRERGAWQRKTRIWRTRGRRTCPSCRASSAAANKPAAPRRPARPRPLGEPHAHMHAQSLDQRCFLTGIFDIQEEINLKRIYIYLFAEMSQHCITTPAEKNTLRLRPKPLTPRKGTNMETMNVLIPSVGIGTHTDLLRLDRTTVKVSTMFCFCYCLQIPWKYRQCLSILTS